MMNASFTPKKVFTLVNDLCKNVTCPKCCQEGNSLYSISCGHLLCDQCLPINLASLDCHSNNNKNNKNKKKQNSKFDCPICGKNIHAEVFSDELVNILAKKTIKLREIFDEKLSQSTINQKDSFDESFNNNVEKENEIKSIKDNSFYNIEVFFLKNYFAYFFLKQIYIF